MDLRSCSALNQIDNAMRLMIRDISIYTGMSEDDVIDNYFSVGNPSIFAQVALPEYKYPLTNMLGRMLSKGHTENRFTIEMLEERN